MKTQRPGRARRAAHILGRALAGAFVLLVLLFVAASVWVQRTFTPERVRPLIVAQLERTFHRRVSIEDVSVALQQGVRVTGLKVFSHPKAPDSVMLSADVMVVTYSLPALLHGRLVLDMVRLVNPTLTLYRQPDGLWNFHGLFERPARASDETPFALPPLSAAKHIRVEAGTVHVVDARHRLDMHAHGLLLSMDDFSFSAPIPWRLRLVDDATLMGRTHHVEVAGDGTMELDAVADARTALELKRLTASVDGRRFSLSGRVNNFMLPDFDAALSLPAFASADLAAWGVRAPAGLSVPDTSWRLRVRTLPVSASTPMAGTFVVERFAGAGGPWSLEGSGRVAAKDLGLAATARTRGAPLGRAAGLFAPWAANDLGGSLDATLTLGGTLLKPRVTRWELAAKGLSATFWNGKRFADTDVTVEAGERFREAKVHVSKGTYIAYSNALTDIDADVSFSSPDLAVPLLALTWNGSRFSLKGCIRDLHTWRKVAVEAEVDRLRVDESYRAIENLISLRLAELGKKPEEGVPWARRFRFSIPKRFPDMVGRLRVSDLSSPNFQTQNLELAWDLRNIARGLKTVSGHFQAGFGPGSLGDIAKLRQADPLVNDLLIPYVEMYKIRQKSRASFGTALPTGLDFTRMFGDFAADGKGTVDVNFIHFDSLPFQAFAAGRADFPKDALDLNVIMRMTEPAQNLPFYMTDDQGRLALDVSLVNDLNKPDVVFHSRKVGSHDIEKGLEEGLGREQPLPDIDAAVACGRGG